LTRCSGSVCGGQERCLTNTHGVRHSAAHMSRSETLCVHRGRSAARTCSIWCTHVRSSRRGTACSAMPDSHEDGPRSGLARRCTTGAPIPDSHDDAQLAHRCLTYDDVRLAQRRQIRMTMHGSCSDTRLAQRCTACGSAFRNNRPSRSSSSASSARRITDGHHTTKKRAEHHRQTPYSTNMCHAVQTRRCGAGVVRCKHPRGRTDEWDVMCA
jgi:hypothetical protein